MQIFSTYCLNVTPWFSSFHSWELSRDSSSCIISVRFIPFLLFLVSFSHIYEALLCHLKISFLPPIVVFKGILMISHVLSSAKNTEYEEIYDD